MAEPGAGLTTEHRDLNEGRTSPDYATAESRILPSYVPVSGPQFPLHRAVFVPEDASQTSGDYGVPLHAADDRDEEVEYGQHEEEDHVAQQPNKDDSGGLNAALRNILEAALSTALLSLPPCFDERDLYLAIASISYTGDLR